MLVSNHSDYEKELEPVPNLKDAASNFPDDRRCIVLLSRGSNDPDPEL